jgi:hypothetical protein
VKILMRKTFVDSYSTSNLNFEIHSLEEHSTIASLVLLNILQEVKIKQEKETTESNNNTIPIMSRSSNSIFNKHVHFQEGEHCWLLPRISSTMTLKPRMICFQ